MLADFADVTMCMYRGKKYERITIALLTDLQGHVCADQLDTIIANLQRAEIMLQFLCGVFSIIH